MMHAYLWEQSFFLTANQLQDCDTEWEKLQKPCPRLTQIQPSNFHSLLFGGVVSLTSDQFGVDLFDKLNLVN